MIKRSFFGIRQPAIEYNVLGGSDSGLKAIPLPETVQLFSDNAFESLASVILKPGDAVKTGQKIAITRTDSIVSTVTGTVKQVTTYTGDFGRTYSSVTIDVAGSEEQDTAFGEVADDSSTDAVVDFLAYLPGKPERSVFTGSDKVQHLIVTGMDDDLLVTTRQFVLKENFQAVKKGIQKLKQMTGAESVYMTVPDRLGQEAVAAGADALVVDAVYPSANPGFVVEKIKGGPLPAGKRPEDEGFCFVSVEAVASIGEALEKKQIPVNKVVTLTDKYNRQRMIRARIGTPLKDIFKEMYITVNENDRVVVGGSMTGAAVYSEDYPICPDTDAVIVQDKSDIPFVTDSYCINCGECVRICPAQVPVNTLVRFLEAGEYEEAADNHDLLACIDCGLCSYVCTARIPVFHYIRLAKYELSRIAQAEEANE